MNKIVAIHQPNFFPWLGFFDKINKSDYFIVLDDAQFPKKSGWTNRVKIIISDNENWITVPVNRNFSGVKKINEITINENYDWRKKILKIIIQNYSKHPYFYETFQFLEPVILNNDSSYLSSFNIQCLNSINDYLNLPNNKLRFSSQIDCDGSSNQLLINLTKSLNCKNYLCGGGASGYQEDDLFKASGINLIYQNFSHPKYSQYNQEKFVNGLSIIDCLMNIGLEETKKTLNIS